MHVWTMMTSLYQAVGMVDVIEWACGLCDHHIQNAWTSRAKNLHQILRSAWMFFRGKYSDDSEGFRGQYDECGTNESVAQTLQRWLIICWKWSTFWKALNNQNTWECWMYMGCKQQRLTTDSVRSRSWFGDSKNYCVWDFDAWSYHKKCGKICSTVFATRAEGTSCCSC